MSSLLQRIGAAAVALTFLGLTAGSALAQDARAALSAASQIEQVKKRGVLRVGLSTFVPWAMRGKDGQLIGYEIDVADRLAKDMGVKVEFVPTAWDGIIPALLAGKFDFIISGMTITPERNLTVNFTHPYSATGVQLVANKKLAPGWTKIEDYNKPGVTLAARRGSSAASAAQRLFPKATLRQFDDDAPALLDVVNGRATAWVSTVPKPEYAVLDHPDELFLPFPNVLVKQADAIALRKGDPDSLNFLNNWILLREQDGWLADRQDYWFKGRPWKDRVAAK